jgi:predicted protein tyrosine phosphatase
VDEEHYPAGVLRLAFDDVPMQEWTDRHGKHWQGPSLHQVGLALDYGRTLHETRPGCLVAVHCMHGKSRSSALALAMMADSLGPGREEEAVQRLLSRSDQPGAALDDAALSQMACNPGIVRMTDRILGREGALERALEAAMPRFVTWRRYWLEHGWK